MKLRDTRPQSIHSFLISLSGFLFVLNWCALFPRSHVLFVYANWQVSWLLPPSDVPSQTSCPVVFVHLRKKGNYSSGHCSGFSPDSLSAPPRKDGTSPKCGCKITKKRQIYKIKSHIFSLILVSFYLCPLKDGKSISDSCGIVG